MQIPILFIIYIYLANAFHYCHIHLYADETVNYFSNVNPIIVQSVLNNELISLSDWMCHNKLYINCEKTVYMLMRSKSILHKRQN